MCLWLTTFLNHHTQNDKGKDEVEKYLMIQNRGEAPIEGYTMLGVSTSRNSQHNGIIGTFGSGNKHAVNLLLRKEISPVIYCGTTKLTFSLKPTIVDDGIDSVNVNHVMCHIKDSNGSRTKELGFVNEYGENDWVEVSMALREFVSNALDRTIKESGEFESSIDNGELCVEVVDKSKVRAKSGFTRVFVPLTSEVQSFYGELPKRFLHFDDPALLKKKILPKTSRNLGQVQTAMIYKHGVLVREVETTSYDPIPSLFDYNFGKELELDECRNASDYNVKAESAKAFRQADTEQLTLIFKSLITGNKCWEGTFDKHYLIAPSWGINETTETQANRKKKWKNAWKNASGDAVLCKNTSFEIETLSRKGKRGVSIYSEQWYGAAADLELDNMSTKVLSQGELCGRVEVPPTIAAQKSTDIVWDWLEAVNMTNNKTKPEVGCFKEISDAEETCFGFFDEKNNKIMLAKDHADGITSEVLQTTLEETVHYITKSGDLSRDFQNYILQFAVGVCR